MNDKKPIYLLAGGRGSKSPDNILKAVFKDIGKTSPTIAYVGAATEDDTTFFQHMSSMVRSAGDCKLVHAVISPRNADLKKAREILEQADAVYVGGGDVEAGMEVLNKKKMTDISGVIKQRETLLRGLGREYHAGQRMGALAGPGR